jgi:branched-subunit amino acid transport protein
VLTAIIVPELVLRGGTLNLAPSNLRLVAGLLAIFVAWRSRNALLTIGIGMAALWILQFLIK